jgi:hypothetical protein
MRGEHLSQNIWMPKWNEQHAMVITSQVLRYHCAILEANASKELV